MPVLNFLIEVLVAEPISFALSISFFALNLAILLARPSTILNAKQALKIFYTIAYSVICIVHWTKFPKKLNTSEENATPPMKILIPQL